MVLGGCGMYSDESEDGLEEVDIYRRKYQLIIERCEVIQQDNERLVNRIQQIKKILKRRRKERKFLMDRLDSHGDNWRNVPLPLQLEENEEHMHATKSHSTKSKSGSKNSGEGSDRSHKKAGGANSGNAPTGKRKSGSKVDKNAPKRPANPYFQFCQEQRNSAIEEMVSIGQAEPSKVEVTKHLANKWNTLTTDDKKIYYDMYEKSKERYNADMQIYTMNKNTMENC